MIKRPEATITRKKVMRKVMRINIFIGKLACCASRIILLISPGGDGPRIVIRVNYQDLDSDSIVVH